MSPADLAAAITASWSASLARNARTNTPHRYVYASAWRPCDRRMVLEMTQPDALPPHPPELLAKFRRGDDRERDILADLMRVGRDADPPFTVIGQQERFELKDHKSRVAITGKVDARLRVGDLAVPVEVKAWSPMMVDRITRFDDLFENPWTRPGAHQLLAYLYGAGVPFGFLLLDRSGLPLLLPVELDRHLDRLEDFLLRAERAIDHVEAGTLPDYLEGDAKECRRCPFFGAVCNPPTVNASAHVFTDPELEALLERRDALDAAATEFDRLDKDVKARLRGVESAVAGPFLIEGSWGKSSRVDLPPDVKAQYTTVDPRGRFTLSITRVG
jgi:hypothetical protein